MLISSVSNFSLWLSSDSGACMEKVPGSCWARVYGVIGILGSWELLVPLSPSLAPGSLSFLFSLVSFLTIFSQTETVETDLQAGANHRYEVHFHCVPKAHKILLLTFMILHFFVLPPWPMYSSYQIFKTFIPEDLRSQKSRTKLTFQGKNLTECLTYFFAICLVSIFCSSSGWFSLVSSSHSSFNH